jgi:hypothetical protein
MENMWEYVHGRIDHGVEDPMGLVESIPPQAPEKSSPQMGDGSLVIGEPSISTVSEPLPSSMFIC